jgi:hypothetical protein
MHCIDRVTANVNRPVHCLERRALPLIAAVVFSSSFTGCRPEGPELADVRGTVRLEGKPLAEALVTFQPTGTGTYSSAFTDKEGNYQLVYSRSRSGALLGAHTVTIRTAPPGIGGVERVPPKYNGKSELKGEVKDGTNVIDFDLESAGFKGTDTSKALE